MGLAELIGTAVLLFLGVSIARQERLIARIAEMSERMKHIPTRKEVTDEIATSRQHVRNEIQEVALRVDGLHSQNSQRGGHRS